MKSTESGVLSTSNYYIHSPSLQAKRTFFYPLFIGKFYYQKGYCVKRSSFNSYLIMYLKRGSMTVSIDGKSFEVCENQIIYIDCYGPHYYCMNEDSVVEWLHFDGVVAKEYFNMITKNSSYVFTLKDTYTLRKNLNKIYDLFHESKPIKEAIITQYITNILTDLIVQNENKNDTLSMTSNIEEAILYINENITQDISLNLLAKKVSLSPYYFTRVFKKETGFTPYQYVLYSRINHAKFLLKNTDMTIKEICFNCGFTCESSFCTSFKKWVNATPSDYRVNSFFDKN